MKLIWLSILVGLAVGCVAPKELSMKSATQEFAPGAGAGNLVVLSPWDRSDTLDPDHLKHSPYKILAENGGKLQRVANRAGSFGAEPVIVKLPAGSYHIRVIGSHAGAVTMPVVIKEGRTTIVRLDGSDGRLGDNK